MTDSDTTTDDISIDTVTIDPDVCLTILCETEIEDEEYAPRLCESVVYGNDLIVEITEDD